MPHPDRRRRKLKCGCAALTFCHDAIRECGPDTCRRMIHRRRGFTARLLGSPVLDLMLCRKRMKPINADVRHRLLRAEVNDDPLWMCRIRLPGEFARQVRIALPASLRIAIGEPGIAMFGAAIARVATMRERVSVRVADWLFQFGAAREVATLVGWVAPRTLRVPVPGADGQFCILSVSDWSPACRETLLHHFRRVDLFDDVVGKNVHRTA